MSYRYFDIAEFKNARFEKGIYLINGDMTNGVFSTKEEAERKVDEIIENNEEIASLVGIGEAISLIITDGEKFDKMCNGEMKFCCIIGDEVLDIPWVASTVQHFEDFIADAIADTDI